MRFIESGRDVDEEGYRIFVSSFMGLHIYNQTNSISSSILLRKKQIIQYLTLLLFLFVVKSWLISTQFGKVLFALLIRSVWVIMYFVRRFFITNRHKQQTTNGRSM